MAGGLPVPVFLRYFLNFQEGLWVGFSSEPGTFVGVFLCGNYQFPHFCRHFLRWGDR